MHLKLPPVDFYKHKYLISARDMVPSLIYLQTALCRTNNIRMK